MCVKEEEEAEEVEEIKESYRTSTEFIPVNLMLNVCFSIAL